MDFVDLIGLLYGERDFVGYEDAWIQLAYLVATKTWVIRLGGYYI